MDRLEIGASTALVGAGIFSIHSHYKDHAGPLADIRSASPTDKGACQRVLDADILTGGLVILVGGSLSYMTGKASPMVLAVLGFALISVYYHASLNGPVIALPTRHTNPTSEEINYDDSDD